LLVAYNEHYLSKEDEEEVIGVEEKNTLFKEKTKGIRT
jgi:hypothetical protein